MATVPTPLFRTKTRGQQLMEQQIGEPLEVALRRLYVDEGLDQRVIGDRWGLDRATISRWLRDFNISRLDRT
jgi:DNA-binding transcriptional regulator LsrR (DeoR family)